MGLFEDLLRERGWDGPGAPPWGRIASTFLGGLQEGIGDGKLLDQLTTWGSHLVRNGTKRWSAAASGTPVFCSHPECTQQGIAPCAVCGRLHCLAHSLVNHHAEAICERCAIAAIAAARRSPSTMDELQARAILGVSRSASWREIKSAYRKLAIKFNADRPMGDDERRSNEARLKEINAAYAVLKAQNEEAA